MKDWLNESEKKRTNQLSSLTECKLKHVLFLSPTTNTPKTHKLNGSFHRLKEERCL